MSDIALTLSSPDVPLTAGKGSLAISVTNSASTPQRIVLGAFPDGPNAKAPALAAIDRPLRTIGAGGTEQYVVAFDTTAAEPGEYPIKFIAYSADGAPEDYADQGQTVRLTVAAAAAVVAKPKFPWWIAAVAGFVVLVLIAAVVYFVTKKDPVPAVAWVPTGPVTVKDNMGNNPEYVALSAAFTDHAQCGKILATNPTDSLWKAASQVCTAAFAPSAAAVDWQTIRKDLKSATASTDCLDVATKSMIEGFLKAHTAAPKSTIKVTKARGYACKPTLAGIYPIQGSRSDSTTIRLIGRLTGKVTVVIDKNVAAAIPAKRVGENDYEAVLPTEPVPVVRTITVTVNGDAIPGFGTFTYLPSCADDPVRCIIVLHDFNNIKNFFLPTAP